MIPKIANFIGEVMSMHVYFCLLFNLQTHPLVGGILANKINRRVDQNYGGNKQSKHVV